MKRIAIAATALAMAAGLSACGHTMEQRAASGALGGAVVGGVLGDTKGAIAGAVVGGVAGAATTPKSE
jgi:osmotically inducible lipoprotein OsmB